MLTGESGWICTAKEHIGWQKTNFDDSGWVTPYVEGEHGVYLFGSNIEGIASSAQWIWTDHERETAELTMWCRYHLGQYYDLGNGKTKPYQRCLPKESTN